MPNNPNNINNNQNNYTQNVSPELEQTLGNQQDSTRNANAPVPSNTTNYEDISGDKQSYTPNNQGLSNTGSGAEAALGTNYSWNKQSSEQAQRTYSADVLTAKQNILNNRQTIENNAANYQAQADMMKYQNNQNAEKVGWTGGYVLDQNRQMEYLKASIQAQMYGAMELQKYGYDSSLAAARLSYDLNQQEYAQKYYQEAVSAALSEAQLTGTYFSAETKDMMSQLAVAQQKENDPNLSEEERAQATKIRESIYNWFSSNGISTEGVKTLEAWQQDQANELQWSNELWTRYQAAIEAANTDIENNPSTFIMLDANGKEMWDGTNVTTGNWDAMTGEQIFNYINGNASATNQYYGYLDSEITKNFEVNFTNYCKKQGYIKTDENGNTTTTQMDYPSLLKGYINQSGVVEKFVDKFKDIDEKTVLDLIGDWDFEIQLPDGTMLNTTYKNLLSGDYADNATVPGRAETITGSSENTAGNVINYSWNDSTPGTLSKEGALNGVNYYKATLTTGIYKESRICITASKAETKEGTTYRNQSDISVLLYKGDKSDTAGGYEAEFEESIPSIKENSDEFNEIVAYCKAASGKGLQEGQLIVIAGTVYCYHKSDITSGPEGRSTYGGTGLYRLGGQCGKSNLYNSLRQSGQWVD